MNDKDSRHANMYKSRLLKDFAMRNHIGLSLVDFTFDFDLIFILTQTTLDYIYPLANVCHCENLYQVYEGGMYSSTSDHFPVLMTIDLHVKSVC